MILKIKCPRCSGPMWEEDVPDSSTVIDLACLYCGYRTFINKRRFQNLKKRIEKDVAKGIAAKRRVLSSQG